MKNFGFIRDNNYIWAILRIAIGLIFLWAFLDKMFGLGFSTCRLESGNIDFACDSAWISGGSPTEGFLEFGTKGPLAGAFQAMAGNALVDWLFMLGLAGVGIGLTLGIAMKLSVVSGIALLILIYLASAVWPDYHPFLDDHIIYAIVLIGVLNADKKQVWGLGKRWRNLKIVEKNKIFQ